MATYYTASYNMLVSSISTSSAGAVAGISYALPGGGNSPAVITWTVTADGSAQSSNLEGSNDDSSWSTLDSNTAATGGTRTFGPTGVKFVRISQVSRTGGTATTATLITDRGTVAGNPGTAPTGPILAPNGSAAAPSYSFTGHTNDGIYSIGAGNVRVTTNGTVLAQFNFNDFQLLRDAATFSFGATPDVILARDAANILAQRNAANAQTFRIYNTFTDASNYERLAISGNTTSFAIISQQAGTGVARALKFGVSNGAQWTISTGGHFVAETDNQNDIGQSGANRPRSIYVGTSFLAPDGSAGTPSISFASDLNTGLYSAGADIIGFAAGGVVKALISTNGVYSNVLVLDIANQDCAITRVGVRQLSAGDGTIKPVINGTLTVNTTSVSTGANTTETDLFNYSLPANALNANGRGIRITAFGNYGANANNKTIGLYFGTTNLLAVTALSNNGTGWTAVGVVIRTGAATQVAQATLISNAANVSPTSRLPTETLSGAVTIRVTGTNGTANAGDITGVGFFVETIN